MSDAAIANIVTGLITVVTIVGGVVTLWLRLKYNVEPKTQEVARKIDQNTELTKSATTQAASNAREAASAAAVAAEKTEAIAKQLNGKMEEKIITLIKMHTEPIVAMIRSHIEQDDKNMAEIRQSLGELRDRIKQCQ